MSDEIPVELYPTIRNFVGALISGLHQLPRDQLRRTQLTSWYRSPAKNRLVGGNPESQHQLALGTDWVTSRPLDFVRAMQRQGLVAVDEGDHVHVQAFRRGELRRLGFFPIRPRFGPQHL